MRTGCAICGFLKELRLDKLCRECELKSKPAENNLCRIQSVQIVTIKTIRHTADVANRPCDGYVASLLMM
jgi:hypothetical protein